MVESLREVSPGLWVSDIDSAGILGDDFALVIDCTGKAPPARNKVHARPTGSTGHSWTVEDLDGIVRLVEAHRAAGPVLIHCRRGVSRSVCAAAAVLLATGVCSTVDGALIRTKFRGETPATQSVAGLRRWWRAREERRQMTLPLSAK